MKECSSENYLQICPIKDAHDRFMAANHFIYQMAANYHKESYFRYNLNAFIESLRSVTFAIQKQKHNIPNYNIVYPQLQKKMSEDALLKRFKEGRNIVVKEGNLKSGSKLQIGLFKNGRMKIAFSYQVEDNYLDTIDIFNKYKNFYVEKFIGSEHNAIGEQFGVYRRWVVLELGDGEVLALCSIAWIKIYEILVSIHGQFNLKMIPPWLPEELEIDFNERKGIILVDTYRVCLKLETDYDPNLIKEWGWE